MGRHSISALTSYHSFFLSCSELQCQTSHVFASSKHQCNHCRLICEALLMTSRQSARVHSAPTGLLLTPTPALTITIYITVPSPAVQTLSLREAGTMSCPNTFRFQILGPIHGIMDVLSICLLTKHRELLQ